MANEIQIFENAEFGKVRVIIIDEEPWFVGKDITNVLGYKDSINALKSHVDEEDKTGWQITTPSRGVQQATIINESGLYSLVLSSKLPSAKKFKHWVTAEVLPSLRKHGAYSLDNNATKAQLLLQIYDGGQDAVIASKQLSELEVKTATAPLLQKIEDDKPYTEFAKHVTESSDSVDVGEFSKIVKNEKIDIGRNRLFQWLRDNKYLMDTNAPYQKYINNGYFNVIKITKSTAYGTKVFPKTLITGRGQVVLVEKLRSEFGMNG